MATSAILQFWPCLQVALYLYSIIANYFAIIKSALSWEGPAHSPFTAAESGSLGRPDPSSAGPERTCMVGEKDAQVTYWWVDGLALLTFDP